MMRSYINGLADPVLRTCFNVGSSDTTYRMPFTMQSHSPWKDKRDSFVREDVNDVARTSEIQEAEGIVEHRKH